MPVAVEIDECLDREKGRHAVWISKKDAKWLSVLSKAYKCVKVNRSRFVRFILYHSVSDSSLWAESCTIEKSSASETTLWGKKAHVLCSLGGRHTRCHTSTAGGITRPWWGFTCSPSDSHTVCLLVSQSIIPWPAVMLYSQYTEYVGPCVIFYQHCVFLSGCLSPVAAVILFPVLWALGVIIWMSFHLSSHLCVCMCMYLLLKSSLPNAQCAVWLFIPIWLYWWFI